MNEEMTDLVGIQIRRVKGLSFKMDEMAFQPVSLNIPLTIFFEFKTGLNIPLNILEFTLKVSFKYQDSIEPCLQAEIQNLFEIKDLPKYIEGTNINLPREALITIVSLSVSHSRALIANYTAGSAFSDTVLPIVDGVAMTTQFFPEKLNVLQ